MNRFQTVLTVLLLSSVAAISAPENVANSPRTFIIDFNKELGMVSPRTGFLGGLRDTMPDDLIQPLQPSLWRIGHQFRGRINTGLTGAVERVEHLGAKYKLVMSDLINSKPKDYSAYEADVKKLVA